MTRKRSERAHAALRLKQRYGHEYTRAFRKTLVDVIERDNRKGPAPHVCKRIHQTCRVSEIVVEDVSGNTYLLIYDRFRKEVVTFLPPSRLAETVDTGGVLR